MSEERTTPTRRRAPAWPPPGLEPVQGRLWPAVGLLASGGIVLGVPLLVGAAVPHPFWSMGPFGDVWWAPMVAGAAGLLLVVVGFERLFRILWSGARAMAHGHRWTTAVAAAADTGDTGYLLAGTGPYSETPGRERRWVIQARLAAAGLALGAAVWLPLSLTVTVVLASRAGLGPLAAWLVCFGPPAVLGLGALLARALEWAMTRGAERAWRALAPADLALDEEVEAWTLDLDALVHRDPAAPRLEGRAHVRGWKAAALATLVLAPLTLLPVGTLTLASVLGPVLGTTAVPRVLEPQFVAIEVEPFRTLRPEPDRETDPAAAARLLAAIRDAEGWLPGPVPFQGGAPALARNGFREAADGLTREQRAFLDEIASRDHEMLTRLGRASALDAAAAHWELPLADTVPWIDREYPRTGALGAGRAHIGLAVRRFADGRVPEAEAALRDVIGMGFLLMDHGVVGSDAAHGASLVRNGAVALEALHRAGGDDDRADRIATLRELGRTSARRARAAAPIQDPAAVLQAMPALVLDTAVVRGTRWDAFGTLTTIGACLNAHNAIFGRGADYDAWLARAESALVRWPGEAAAFEARRNGDLVPPGGPRSTFLTRILGVTLGNHRDPESCAALLGSARP